MDAKLTEYQLSKIENYLPQSHLKEKLPYIISLTIRVNNENDVNTLKSELDKVLNTYNILIK